MPDGKGLLGLIGSSGQPSEPGDPASVPAIPTNTDGLIALSVWWSQRGQPLVQSQSSDTANLIDINLAIEHILSHQNLETRQLMSNSLTTASLNKLRQSPTTLAYFLADSVLSKLIASRQLDPLLERIDTPEKQQEARRDIRRALAYLFLHHLKSRPPLDVVLMVMSDHLTPAVLAPGAPRDLKARHRLLALLSTTYG